MFKHGHTSILYKDLPARSNEVTTSKMIEKIPNIVANDRGAKMRDISDTVGISIKRAQNILRAHLDMKQPQMYVWRRMQSERFLASVHYC